MIINILKIKNAFGEKKSFHFSEKVNDIELNGQKFIFEAPVEVSGEIINTNGFYEVKGQAHTTVRTDCFLCLEPFHIDVRGSLEEVYAHAEDILENSNVDSEMVEFVGDNIDIEQEVVKSLLVELPMRLTCSPNCKGLCQKCGCNLNDKQCNCQTEDIDPRLAVLTKLKQ